MFGPKKKKVKRPAVPCELDLPETDEQVNTATDESSSAAAATVKEDDDL